LPLLPQGYGVMAAPPKLELAGVKKRFGPKVVLDGVDLAIAPKQSMVVIGGSGTGKSVMLKCVLGLLRPDAGAIRVDGEETTRLKGADRQRMLRKFGMLFQGAALFDSLSVWRNVAFGLIEGQKMATGQAKEIALDKLRRVGLGPEVGELSPAELSGGMKKRVALARAIASEPEIIFFDEPTTGLDPIMGDVINRLIVECVKELGATTLTITHDMASVRAIADRVAMLHKGRIVWEGPVEAIDRSGSDYVDQFVHGRAEGPIQMEVR
jgi:phospholipid/cholesterol/gamma-HCH transport system ATP-binding protein